jgi:hypothetical protein
MTDLSQPLVMSREDLAHARRISLVIGILLGLLVATVTVIVLIGMGFKPRVIVGAPEILSQTETETIARVPTLFKGETGACTITINHKHRSWSVNC